MGDSSHPVPVRRLRGQVTRGEYAAGTKSEREAVFIDTDDGRYVLRLKGHAVFGDAELERFIGRTVACSGFLVGTTLLVEDIELVG